MANGIEPVTRAEVSPTADGTYYDVDSTLYGVPVGAEGLILEVENTSADTDYAFSIRMNGSTDAFYRDLDFDWHGFMFIGCDANAIIEIKLENAAINVYIWGYIPDGAGEFVANAVDVGIVAGDALNTWLDKDLSGTIAGGTGEFVFLYHYNLYAATNIGVRENGATDAITWPMTNYDGHIGMISGLDANEVMERSMGVVNANFKLYYYGALYDTGALSLTNGVDYSTGTAGSYVDADVGVSVPAGSDFAIIWAENSGTTGYSVGLRKNGETYDNYRQPMRSRLYAPIEVDANRVLEQMIESATYNDLFVIGYSKELPAGGGYEWTVEPLVENYRVYCEAWTGTTIDTRRDITNEEDQAQVIADMKVAFPGSDSYKKHTHNHNDGANLPCVLEEV